MFNSTIKPKLGICPECNDNKEKTLTSGLCPFHYKKHRSEVNKLKRDSRGLLHFQDGKIEVGKGYLTGSITGASVLGGTVSDSITNTPFWGGTVSDPITNVSYLGGTVSDPITNAPFLGVTVSDSITNAPYLGGTVSNCDKCYNISTLTTAGANNYRQCPNCKKNLCAICWPIGNGSISNCPSCEEKK